MNLPYSMTTGYPADILNQPQALADTYSGLFAPTPALERVKSLACRRFDRLVLTGMGSSFHALHPLYLQLIQRGLPAWMVETSELIHNQTSLLLPNTLVVAVSQSGSSAETLRLLEITQISGIPVLGVTNTPTSPLAESANSALLTRAGEETSVSCKTYLSTLMALSWLGDVICGEDLSLTRHELEQASPLTAAYLANWAAHVEWLMEELRATRNLFLAGRGVSLAAVGTGALITKESTHVHAEGMSSAAFRHGPMELLAEDIYLLVFAGNGASAELNRRLADEVKAQGFKAGLVHMDSTPHALHLPPAPERLQPMLEILPVEMVTLALASLRGRTPGIFERGAKVTTSE